MSNLKLVRYYHPDSGRGLGIRRDNTVYDISHRFSSIGEWLRASAGRVNEAVQEIEAIALQSSKTFDASIFDHPPASDVPHWLAPVEEQQVWAAGVTYERSREARQEEAIDGGDVYARVYGAQRPEIFFKALGKQVVGPLGFVGIRSDATWSIPEPELGVVMNPNMEIVGFTAGNDMSSRDIEGENPLYLPQAKVYKLSCALGDGILLQPNDSWPIVTISLRIYRNGSAAFEGEISTRQIKRALLELAEYLGRCNTFEDGVILLTGTGIVPPADFTLAEEDVVEISIEGIGTLKNTVKVV